MSVRRLAFAVTALLGVVILFQVLLVFGAPWGEFTQGGQEVGALPSSGKAAAGLSAVVLIAMALGLLARADIGPLKKYSPRMITGIAWFSTVYAGIAIVVNLSTPSAKERAVWAPFSLVLFVLMVILMVKTRKQAAS